ncbi:protein INVOLVED IN DE NOVO [Trifolium repens]|nr:protein INVOLVED IN DE NOVO [Trifolium repens]
MENQQNADGCENQTKGKMISSEARRPLGWIAKAEKCFKEKIHAKTIELEKNANMKQNLELEIKQLKVSLNLLKDFKDEEDDESLQDLHELNQTLVIHGRKINDELQDARKELINSSQFSTLPFKNIGVKRMGELDIKPFIDAMKKKYNENEAEIRAFELHSLWEENIRNPNWYPFKIILTDGLAKQVIDEEDEKLDGLKKNIVFAYCVTDTATMDCSRSCSSDPIGGFLWFTLVLGVYLDLLCVVQSFYHCFDLSNARKS